MTVSFMPLHDVGLPHLIAIPYAFYSAPSMGDLSSLEFDALG